MILHNAILLCNSQKRKYKSLPRIVLLLSLKYFCHFYRVLVSKTKLACFFTMSPLCYRPFFISLLIRIKQVFLLISTDITLVSLMQHNKLPLLCKEILFLQFLDNIFIKRYIYPTKNTDAVVRMELRCKKKCSHGYA